MSLPSHVDPTGDWETALSSWLLKQNDFTKINVRRFRDALADLSCGPRMAVNIGSYALLCFLRDGAYLNRYDKQPPVPARALERVGGPGEDTDERRERVDGWIAPPGHGGNEIYFGAAALESAGVRLYGEYCLVITSTDAGTQILDRDSYELDLPPLRGLSPSLLVQALSGSWGQHLTPMAILKVRGDVENVERLVTEERLTNGLLFGEEFIEVHRIGNFGPSDVFEVRQCHVEVAEHERLGAAFDHGVLPTIEELVWLGRRARIDAALTLASLGTRVVGAAAVG